MPAQKRFALNSAWLAGLFLVFFLLFASGASKPLHLDNMDFPAVAAQTAITGVPIYYRGEDNPRHLGLYHPPLYIYSLAAWIKVFGFGETQVRMFGMVCAVLLGLITLELLYALLGRASIARWRHWFWLLFLLNPYTIQGASIADIDTTVYGPLLCGVLLAAVRMSWRDGVWREDSIRSREYAQVVLMLTLCLWAKLTTVLIVFPFIFLLLIPRMAIGRAARVTAAVVSAGIAGFLATYFIYGKLTGLDVNYTFAFLWMSFLVRGSSHTSGLAARFVDFENNARFMVPFMVRWTGLLPWLAAFWVMCSAFMRAWRACDRRAAHFGLLILLALLTTGYYCGKVGTFGAAPFKYVFVFWGLELSAAVLLTFSGPQLWDSATTKDSPLSAHAILNVLTIGIPLALGLVCTAIFVGDRLILVGAAGVYKWVVLIPGLACLIGAAFRSRPLGRGFLIAGFSAYCGLQLGVALWQSKVDYATTYDYGQTGFMDTVGFLRLNTSPDDVIVSMKDIGFRAHRRYYENYGALYGDDRSEQGLIQVIASGKVAYEVFTEGRGQDQLVVRPSLQKWIAEHCELVRSFGNYRIYKYRRTP